MNILVLTISYCLIMFLLMIIQRAKPAKFLFLYPEEIRKTYCAEMSEPSLKRITLNGILYKTVITVLFITSNMLFIKAPKTTDDFLSAFMQSYILWIIPSFFKNIIFGCLWFCNDRGFILKNTEHMTKLYKDRSFFILRFIRLSVSGMILSVGFAFLAG